ncbi:MAG: nucleotidyltransferase domain-containing protein [Bacteroidales bacterium]|nr:nucleotidyltransferase domain-containing protein [Bacteroidales bacterium]
MNTQIFEQIRQLKRQIMPNERLILFGSQARGDARRDSDWDLLILLNKDKRTQEDYDQYAFPFDELGWSYGVAINAKLYTNEQWERGRIFPFYQNVMREGIEIN